jgi:uncharacterized protein YbjT (DUF2867 family)
MAARDGRVTVLLAGATGALGRELLRELRDRGTATRALVRKPGVVEGDHVVADLADERAGLDAACRGVDTVISVAGQSTATGRIADRRTYDAVDHRGNARLLEAARRAGAQRFLYVSIFNAERLRGLAYVDAHERFVERLQASGLEATIVRANGFFAAYRDLYDIAAAGRPVPLVDGGRARSNPIHEADLARACLEALDAGATSVDVGGPETLTRREEAELAFAAAGREPRTRPLPRPIARAGTALLRPLDPRRAAILAFLARINGIDMVAPAYGSRRLGDYLADLRT